MKKILFLLTFLLVLSIFFLSNKFFKKNEVKAQNNEKPVIYIHGDNEYQRNGLLAFSSQEAPIVGISSYNLKNENVNVDVYNSEIDDFLKFLVHDEKNRQIYPKVSLDNKYKIGTVEIKSGDKFELPINENGVFIVHAYSDDVEAFSFVIRSNTGVVFKEGKDSLLVWTQDLKTKRKIPNQNITFYNLKEKINKLDNYKTNSDGLAETKLSDQYDVAIVGNKKDLSFVKLNLTLNDYYNSFNLKQSLKHKYFLFTDRTLYKPGDVLYFKAILRDDNDIDYLIPNGQWIAKISYWDEKEQVLAEKIFYTNDFGSFDGEFKIPEDVKTGDNFTLSIEKLGQNKENLSSYFYNYYDEETYFSVENYRKPEYTLNVESEKTESMNQLDIVFNIDGKYFSGQPLNGEKVDYVIRSRDFYEDTFYNEQDFNYYKDNYYFGSYGNQIQSGSVYLDNDGKAKVSVKANILDGKNKIYSIELNYASEVGENVKAQKNVLVYAAEYSIYRKDYRWNFNLNEDVKLDLFLKEMRDDVDLSNREIKIISAKRIWWEKNTVNDGRDRSHYNYTRKEESINSFEMKTDSSGKFQVIFHPEKAGSYEFFVSSLDSKNNFVSKKFNFWVSDENYFYSDQSNGLSLNMDSISYKPGGIAKINIYSELADRDVLFSVDRDFVHYYKVITLNGVSGQTEFPVLKEYMPSMNLSAVSFSDNDLDTTYEDMKVSAESEKLNIDISTDKDTYGAGDEVKVNIKVSDQKGNPQVAEITLWTIDKALLELTESSEKNSFNYFWNYRNGYTSVANSLEEFGINAAESGGGCFKGGTKILMADKSFKNIEDVNIGDFILTRNGENDDKLVSAKVVSLHQKEVDGYFVVNDYLKVTENHLIWVNQSWRRVDKLKVGDILIDKNGENVIVRKLFWQKEKTKVYNLEIENKHSYFADVIWVHNGKGGSERSIFKDTAYWAPNVVTNKMGESEVSFRLPDDLTTWVFSIIGSTKDSKFGNATYEIKTSQPVILRPQLPNFLYSGDEATIYVDAQNFSGEKREFLVTANFDGGEVKNTEQKIEIENGETKELSFDVVPNEEKESKITFSINPIINSQNLSEKESNEIKSKFSDKIVKTLSIEKYGFLEKTFLNYKVGENNELNVNEDALNNKTRIELEVASSLVDSLPSAMDYILDYPYGCVEQTTSRFSVTLKVKQNLEYFSSLAKDRDIDKILNEGVERLKNMQNNDGGWGWINNSDNRSTPFVSVYVVESLLEAKNSGIKVDDSVLSKAKEYFINYNFDNIQESDLASLERKIIITYGRVLFGKNSSIIELNDRLDPDILAFGVMANELNGFAEPEKNGMNILKSMIKSEGNQYFWQKGSYYRFGSTDGSTALALRTIILDKTVDRNVVEGCVRYLSNSRKNSYWSNTFTTSQIIKALSEYANKYEDNKLNKSIKVYLDNKNVLSAKLNAKKPFTSIDFSTNEIKKDSVIRFDSSDDVYVSLVKREFRTNRNIEALNKGINIEKNYYNQNDTGKIGKGDIVDVEIKISGLDKDSMAYLVVDDKLPAGLVPINNNLKNAVISDNNQVGYAYPEYKKDGVIFYKEYVNYNVLIFHYQAKAISSGKFISPPTVAELMYNPDVYTRTETKILQIEKTSQKDFSKNQIKNISTDLHKKEESSLNYWQKNKNKIFISYILGSIIIVSSYIIHLIFRDWRKNRTKNED